MLALVKAYKLSVKPVLSLESDRDDGRGLTLASSIENEFGSGAVAVIPGSLNKKSPGVRVAGLGDRTTALYIAGGMLRRNKSKVGHQAGWSSKATDIIDLAEQSQGGQGLDSSEAAESLDFWSVGHGSPSLLKFAVDRSDLRLEILEMFEIDRQGGLEMSLQRLSKLTEPEEVLLRPCGLCPVKYVTVIAQGTGDAVLG